MNLIFFSKEIHYFYFFFYRKILQEKHFIQGMYTKNKSIFKHANLYGTSRIKILENFFNSNECVSSYSYADNNNFYCIFYACMNIFSLPPLRFDFNWTYIKRKCGNETRERTYIQRDTERVNRRHRAFAIRLIVCIMSLFFDWSMSIIVRDPRSYRSSKIVKKSFTSHEQQ